MTKALWPTIVQNYISGKALDFDGVNDHIVDQTINVNSTSFSVSFYAKYSDHSTANSCAFSIGPSGFGTGYDLVVYPFDGSLKTFRIYSRYNDDNILSDSSIPITGVFNHYVVQSDGTNLSVYANGVLAASVAYDNDRTFTRFQIGKLITGTQYYVGQLSNFKLFNTALTAAQVADLYNNPEKVVPTGVDNTALKLFLPMQEGAGTTAYDGSGNGNHGTISGATYTHGIGAPVAQTAVIDWNKGTNLVVYSEQFDNAAWAKANTTITANATTSPDGTLNADLLYPSSTGVNRECYKAYGYSYGLNYSFSVYAKAGGLNWVFIGTDYVGGGKGAWFNLSTGVVGTQKSGYTATIENAGNGYYRCIVSFNQSVASNYYTIILTDADNSFSVTKNGTDGIYIWGASVTQTSSVQPYIPTFATAQTSEVLLPQGLTTGRDITGVNLFENVRKQGALNLDGNSWAEVHDNGVVDITDAVSVECWVNVTDGSANKMLISKWSPYADDQRSYLLYLTDGEYLRFSISSDGQNSHTVSSSQRHFGAWKHFVATYDKTTLRLYVNGAAENTAAQTAAINVGTFQVEIGRHQGDTSAISSDSIAQPRIYNRALTAEEVQRNYNAGKNTYTN